MMYQDSPSKHWYPAVIESLYSQPRSYKIITRDGIVYRKTLSHQKPFTPQNKCVSTPMAQCGQWKLSPRRSHKWTIICKYRQASLKGTLGLLSSLIFKYFKVYLVHIWIYSVFRVFTIMHKCPHNRVQDAKSCTCMCMYFNVKWTMATQGLWYRPLDTSYNYIMS